MDFYSKEDFDFSNAVVEVLQDLNLDDDSIAAGFLIRINLNDSKSEIEKKFGLNVITKLELLQRLSKISFPETTKQVANLRKQFIEIVDDLSIIFIKLTERLVSLKFAEKSSNDDLLKTAEECLYLYSPIAHRLGVRVIYQSMDDISFKHLYPAEYLRLYKAIEKRRDILEKKLKEMHIAIYKKLSEENIQAQIQFRVKRLYSIFLKLKNKGVILDDVFDLMALRIIVDKPIDCYQVLGIVHSNYAPIEGRFRDWVTYPKPNGYRSIQTTVINRKGDKFEVQIRTQQMNREAEYGSAAHWAYKEGQNADSSNWIIRLKEFLETDEYFNNPYELQELLKSEFKRDFIHVLTPKGDIKTLRKDSSPVDFAYSIHTDLGSKVTGAKVNGKLVKLKTTLKSGDVVEVITAKNGKPSRDWLTFVKTPKARSKILIWIKKHEKDQLIADGKRLWEKYKKQYRAKLQNNADEQSFRNNLPAVGFKSADDFYSAISINSLKLSQTLLRRVYPEAFQKAKRKIVTEKHSDNSRTPRIIVEGLEGIETKLSKCCNPIKGEEIVAFVTQKSEIKIHSVNCKYIQMHSNNKDRYKRAEWAKSDSSQTVRLKVYGRDFENMVLFITETASNEKIDLTALDKTIASKGAICINLEIDIKDIDQLRKYISKIKSSKLIENVNFV